MAFLFPFQAVFQICSLVQKSSMRRRVEVISILTVT